MNETHGPYFKGQQSSADCGCFYPDVARCNSGALHCCHHGWVKGQGQPSEIPTDEWREAERVRLRQRSQEISV